jgi:purine-nucleoside phosphorylase
MTHAYDPVLRATAATMAAGHGLALRTGVYAGLAGPQYETPAEIRMLAALGADAVGMSTVLETIQARALGIRVCGFSCLTNYGAGLSTGVNHGEVLETGRVASARFGPFLGDYIRRIAREES